MTREERTALAALRIRSGTAAGLESLKDRRLAAGLTQKRLADKIGVSLPTYQQWESGRFWPTSVHLPQMASILGCTIEDLYLPMTDGRRPDQ